MPYKTKGERKLFINAGALYCNSGGATNKEERTLRSHCSFNEDKLAYMIGRSEPEEVRSFLHLLMHSFIWINRIAINPLRVATPLHTISREDGLTMDASDDPGGSGLSSSEVYLEALSAKLSVDSRIMRIACINSAAIIQLSFVMYSATYKLSKMV